MGKLLRRALSSLNNAATLWGVIPATWQTAVTALAVAVVGYLEYQANGIAVAIIAASAVFGFSMLGIFMWVAVTRLTSVYERLIVEKIGMAVGYIDVKKDGRNRNVGHILKNFTLEITLRNHSPQQTIYFQIKRVTHSIGTATISGVPKISSLVNTIPPQAPLSITLQTLPDIPLIDNLTGHIELEILYGGKKDNLRYLLIYESTPLIGAMISKKGSSQLAISAPILQHRHLQVTRDEQRQIAPPV